MDKAFSPHDLPLAAAGLTSYRYRSRLGYVMIGATDNEDALREARRSVTGEVLTENLEVWSGTQYGPAYPEPDDDAEATISCSMGNG